MRDIETIIKIFGPLAIGIEVRPTKADQNRLDVQG